MRIALIHALTHSVEPSNAAFAKLWPAAELANIYEGSLAADLARAGRLTPAMTERFIALARYARLSGADAILFTCSAFGPCIEACAAELAPMPVLKPNEAMIEEAVRGARRIGLLATYAPTLASMPAEFAASGEGSIVVPMLAEGALAALDAGEPDVHDRIAADAAQRLADCDVIALAQFSLARAAPAVAARVGLPVLSTPESAVRKLRRLFDS